MIEVPVALLVAEWVLLLGLGAMVLLMYRQLAYLLGLSRAISGAGGLKVGEQVPSFEYTAASADGEGDDRRAFSPEAPRRC